jgi:ATP-dependent Lon protease
MLQQDVHFGSMKQAHDDDASISGILSRVLEDRAEFSPAEDRQMRRPPNIDVPITLLQTGRWDLAFHVVWLATRLTPDLQDDPALPGMAQAHAVSTGKNHALGREFATKMAYLAHAKKQIPLSIAWKMLAADATKPATILVFIPQLTRIVAMNPVDMDPKQRMAVQNALEVWLDAAEGRYAKLSGRSLFTLQFSAAKPAPISVIDIDPKLRGIDQPALEDKETVTVSHVPEVEVPCAMVMQRPVAKLTVENAAFNPLIDRWMALKLAPDLQAMRATLVAEYPHAVDAIDLLMRDLRTGQPIRLNPMVIVGPPGNGKSRLVRRFAELLKVGMVRFDASNASDSVGFGGTPRGWTGSVPSLPARAILQHNSPSILISIDEIEKCGTGTQNGNFLSTLTPYLERETSSEIRDVSLDAVMDLSWISYIATANTDVGLPSQIKDRFRVVRMPAPTLEHLPALVRNVLAEMAHDDGLDLDSIEPLQDDELAVAGAAWARSKFSIRALQKIVNATVEARAMFPGMRH